MYPVPPPRRPEPNYDSNMTSLREDSARPNAGRNDTAVISNRPFDGNVERVCIGLMVDYTSIDRPDQVPFVTEIVQRSQSDGGRGGIVHGVPRLAEHFEAERQRLRELMLHRQTVIREIAVAAAGIVGEAAAAENRPFRSEGFLHPDGQEFRHGRTVRG